MAESKKGGKTPQGKKTQSKASETKKPQGAAKKSTASTASKGGAKKTQQHSKQQQKQAKPSTSAGASASSKAKSQSSPEKSGGNWPFIVIAVIVVVALVALGFMYMNGNLGANDNGSDSVTGDQNGTVGVSESANADEVMATVNGEEITRGEFNVFKDMLGSRMAPNSTEKDMLKEMVLKELLVQEAQERGISVTEKEVEEKITSQISGQGIGLEQYKKLLKQRGVEYDAFVELIREQTMIQNLSNQLMENASVTDEEVKSYYEENQARFGNKTYEEVSPAIRRLLEQQSQGQVLSELADKLKKEADISYKN